jgi:hypothetical protein
VKRGEASGRSRAIFAVVAVWWVCIPASHDRPWRREVAVLPWGVIDSDRVRLTGFRTFTYRSEDDFDVRYEQRQVSVAHLARTAVGCSL